MLQMVGIRTLNSYDASTQVLGVRFLQDSLKNVQILLDFIPQMTRIFTTLIPLRQLGRIISFKYAQTDGVPQLKPTLPC